DKTVLKVTENANLIPALGDIFDTQATAADRISAGLKLLTEVAGLVPEDQLSPLVTKIFEGLPAATQLAQTVLVLLDSKKSIPEKAKAALEFVVAAKSAAGKLFPDLANDLRKLQSRLAVIGSALTLLDGNASWREKAQAVVKLLANARELLDDLNTLKRWLTERGIKGVAEIIEEVRKLPPSALHSADAVTDVESKVVQELPANDAEQLKRLVVDPKLEKSLPKLMEAVKGTTATHTLIDVLAKVNPAVCPAVVAALSGLEHGVLNKLLASTTASGKPLAQAFAELMARLPESSRESLGKLIADFDDEALKCFLKCAEPVDSKILGTFLEFAAKNFDSKVASGMSKALLKALKEADRIFGKVGLKLGKEVAGKIFKGLAKMVPVAGAVPAALAVWDNAKLAVDPSVPPELRYLASLSGSLNAVDAVLGIIEVLGVTNVDLPIQLALGAAELLLDLVIFSQLEKFKANPKSYKAPDWLDALIAATALASSPHGMVLLVATFGVAGAERKLLKAAAMGGKLGIAAGEQLATSAANETGRQLKMTGAMLHGLAELIRNPGKYLDILNVKIDQAVATVKATGEKAWAVINSVAMKAADAVVYVINKGGELASQAWTLMKEALAELRQRWEQGIEILRSIAQNPGQFAELAIEALKSLVQEGLLLATAAAKKMVQLGLAALGKLHDFYLDAKQRIKKGFEKAVAATKEAFNQAVDYALQKGLQCLETLRWVLNNPGTAARMVKDKLVKVITGVGQAAKQAFKMLVDLGKAGLEHVTKAITALKEKAEEGLKLIVWVAQNPGQAAKQVVQAAVGAVKDLAEGATELAKSAVNKLVQFAEGQLEVAKEARAVIIDLIKQGKAAGERILEAWKVNLTEGGKAVLAGLKDVGDAGAEALGRAVAKGGQLVQEGLKHLEALMRKGAQAAFKALDSLARKGGALARSALETLKRSAPVQFATRVFDTLMQVGNRKDVKDFLHATENAFKVVARAYDSGGLTAVAQLVGRTGLDIGSHLVATLWAQRRRLAKAIDSVTEFAQAFISHFTLAELEQILGVDIPLVGN
ncbi:hypothetical protein, partial [Hyalangium sp.]|uniref:hypothetical protein n=1 Tax=Hyalangium sp. TaxID=2028555 RepID=UPI002D5910E1